MALFGKKSNDMNSLGGPPIPNEMNTSPPYMDQMPPNGGQQDYYNQQPPTAGPDMEQMPPPDMNAGPDIGPVIQDMNSAPDMGQMPPLEMGNYPDQNMSQGNFPDNQFQQSFGADDTKERVEEIAEAIIDEKWNELIKDINKVIEWKERTDTELKRMGQEIINLKERFESLHTGILGKITEYDQNLTNVGSEIKAMEMAFQKILPSFTENVNKLDRLVKSSDSKR